jgi:DNA-binding transcriptional MerR regulator
MKVVELARKVSVTPDSVRYYTRIGLLEPHRNRANGYKDYSLRDESRLRFILSARQLGFSIQDIQQIVGVADKGDTPCPLVRELIAQRLAETEKNFATLLKLRERMSLAVTRWAQEPNK